MIASILGRAGQAVFTGLVGAVAYDGAKRAVHTGVAREGAVTLVALGLRGKRSTEAGAERLRLVTGDLVAEARERVGEQAPPPGVGGDVHDHQH